MQVFTLRTYSLVHKPGLEERDEISWCGIWIELLARDEIGVLRGLWAAGNLGLEFLQSAEKFGLELAIYAGIEAI